MENSCYYMRIFETVYTLAAQQACFSLVDNQDLELPQDFF